MNPPNVIERYVSSFLQYGWFRRLVMRRVKPDGWPRYAHSRVGDGSISGSRPPIVRGTRSTSIVVSGLEEATKYYRELYGFQLLGTVTGHPHPTLPRHTVAINSLGLGATTALTLVQITDPNGRPVAPSRQGLMHMAFELKPPSTNRSVARFLRRVRRIISYGPVKHYDGPGGDGGWGGNCAVYTHDPDGHMVEIYHGMDPFGTPYPVRGKLSEPGPTSADR